MVSERRPGPACDEPTLLLVAPGPFLHVTQIVHVDAAAFVDRQVGAHDVHTAVGYPLPKGVGCGGRVDAVREDTFVLDRHVGGRQHRHPVRERQRVVRNRQRSQHFGGGGQERLGGRAGDVHMLAVLRDLTPFPVRGRVPVLVDTQSGPRVVDGLRRADPEHRHQSDRHHRNRPDPHASHTAPPS